jgi:hypothetical protein
MVSRALLVKRPRLSPAMHEFRQSPQVPAENRNLLTMVYPYRSLALSAVLLSGRLDGATGPAEIIGYHHRMDLDARIQRQEPRFGNRRDL